MSLITGLFYHICLWVLFSCPMDIGSITMTCFDVIQGFLRTREVGEFVSGALAGAMTKAVLAPLETIRLALLSNYFHSLFHEVNVFSITFYISCLCAQMSSSIVLHLPV
jgi:hypothetical protein